MSLVELNKKDGTRFLFDINSQWEIIDKGLQPALWTNYAQGRNLDCSQTYEEIKKAFSFYDAMAPDVLKKKESDRENYPAKCPVSDFHCSYPECNCGRKQHDNTK